jgi:hypothetical protein
MNESRSKRRYGDYLVIFLFSCIVCVPLVISSLKITEFIQLNTYYNKGIEIPCRIMNATFNDCFRYGKIDAAAFLLPQNKTVHLFESCTPCKEIFEKIYQPNGKIIICVEHPLGTLIKRRKTKYTRKGLEYSGYEISVFVVFLIIGFCEICAVGIMFYRLKN